LGCAEGEKVTVSFDEAGHGESAFQIDATRGRTGQTEYLLVGADMHDPIASDGKSRRIRKRRVESRQASVPKNQIGQLLAN
jgi:hypothetical protein